MMVRSKAPLRVSFAGGGTDVSPYPETKGGAVLNATIDKYAYCTLSERDDDAVEVYSLDYDVRATFGCPGDLAYDGKLDLVKAAIRVFEAPGGYDLFLHSSAPVGSGLGASSTVAVALVGCFRHLLGVPMGEYDVAEAAYRIEREELGVKGGRQDQYAASFGGFNFIEFYGDHAVVNPLKIKSEVINELEYRLLLCFTGKTRPSAGIIEDQVTGYLLGDREVVSALDLTKQLAYDMKRALLLGRLEDFGALLHEGWTLKKKFSQKISHAFIDEMYDEALKCGAIGGKLLGAGGGGYLLFFCEYDKKHIVAERLESMGGRATPFAFEFRGLQTWEVTNGAFFNGQAFARSAEARGRGRSGKRP